MARAALPVDGTKFSRIVEIRDLLLTKSNPMRLESGQPDFDTPDHIKEAAVAALRAGKTGYAPSSGVAEFKQAVVQKMLSHNGLATDTDYLIAVQGGMHGLFVTLSAVAAPGERILLANPTWGATRNIVIAVGAIPVFVDMGYDETDGFTLSPKDIAKAIEAHKPVAFVLNNPHNPTGAVIPDDTLEEIVHVCAERGVHLIGDEAYEDIYYASAKPKLAATIHQQLKLRSPVTSVFTFSKSYSMTGWRLGYVVTNDETTITRLKKLVLYSANGINTFIQYAGAVALTGPQDCTATFREGYRKRRDLLVEGVNASKAFTCVAPKGAFYLHARVENGMTGEEMARLLVEKHELGTVPGGFFNARGEDGFIRWAYCCSEEMVRRASELMATL
ncbi:MAG: pyridoxal phosphate-dependent aminotransferase [bacterium]